MIILNWNVLQFSSNVGQERPKLPRNNCIRVTEVLRIWHHKNFFCEALYRSEYYSGEMHHCEEMWGVETHRAPPQCIRIGGKVFIELFFHQINQERGKDEHKEPNVPGSDQFLLDREADTDI